MCNHQGNVLSIGSVTHTSETLESNRLEKNICISWTIIIDGKFKCKILNVSKVLKVYLKGIGGVRCVSHVSYIRYVFQNLFFCVVPEQAHLLQILTVRQIQCCTINRQKCYNSLQYFNFQKLSNYVSNPNSNRISSEKTSRATLTASLLISSVLTIYSKFK